MLVTAAGDHQIACAKKEVLALAEDYAPPEPTELILSLRESLEWVLKT